MQAKHKISKIVVALDGSDHAAKALDFAIDLAEQYDAKLTTVSVISDQPISEEERHLAEVEYHTDVIEKLNADALLDVRGDPRAIAGMLAQQYGDAARIIRRGVFQNFLDKANTKIKSRGITNFETVIAEGDPAKVILETAKDIKADLIMLGSRGLSNLGGLLMGSVSPQGSANG